MPVPGQNYPPMLATNYASCQTEDLFSAIFGSNCEPSNAASCQTKNIPYGNFESSPLCGLSLPSLLVLKEKLQFIANNISTFIDLRGNIIKNTLESVITNQQIDTLKPNTIQFRSINNPKHMNINEATVNSKMYLNGDLVSKVS